ncbi:pentatricopeptide repeat (PPR) superfamily protein [Wolffia australiana]
MLGRTITSSARRGGWAWRSISAIHGGGEDRHGQAFASTASSPSLSIWRRKKEMGKEGLFVVHELKRLHRASSDAHRLQHFLKSSVSRLVRTDLLAVLAELQRQDLVFLSLQIYEIVRKETWYRPDMFFSRDMLLMLARNGEEEAARRVWADLVAEGVRFDQHTFGDLVRAFFDGDLPGFAMEIYAQMRESPDPPLSLPFRVILKGLLRFPELRRKVKDDFLLLFPGMIVCDPPDDEQFCFEHDRDIR